MTHTNVPGAEKIMASQWTRANSAEKKVPHTRIEDESSIQVEPLSHVADYLQRYTPIHTNMPISSNASYNFVLAEQTLLLLDRCSAD